MRKKQIHLLLLVVVAVFIIFMELGFRSYLYKQSGFSSLIAGSLPNFVAVVFLSLIFVLRNDGQKEVSILKPVVMAVIAMLAY